MCSPLTRNKRQYNGRWQLDGSLSCSLMAFLMNFQFTYKKRSTRNKVKIKWSKEVGKEMKRDGMEKKRRPPNGNGKKREVSLFALRIIKQVTQHFAEGDHTAVLFPKRKEKSTRYTNTLLSDSPLVLAKSGSIEIYSNKFDFYTKPQVPYSPQFHFLISTLGGVETLLIVD